MATNDSSVSTTGSFLKGATKGAMNGGLMAGIFYSIAIGAKMLGWNVLGLHGAGLLATVSGVLPVAGLMILAVGLFSGVMAVHRAHEEHRAARDLARDFLRDDVTTRGMSPELTTEQATMMSTYPPAGVSWAERTGGPANDRIQAILSNGSLSAKDRASAILAARDADVAASNSR